MRLPMRALSLVTFRFRDEDTKSISGYNVLAGQGFQFVFASFNLGGLVATSSRIDFNRSVGSAFSPNANY